jgi:hypothetical protein
MVRWLPSYISRWRCGFRSSEPSCPPSGIYDAPPHTLGSAKMRLLCLQSHREFNAALSPKARREHQSRRTGARKGQDESSNGSWTPHISCPAIMKPTSARVHNQPGNYVGVRRRGRICPNQLRRLATRASTRARGTRG